MDKENNLLETRKESPIDSQFQEDEQPTFPRSSFGEGALLGEVLQERYQIEKKLGDGGFGSVFLARDRRLVDKLVVVKVLNQQSHEWVFRKFQQEREALSRIEHPGVVGVLDAGQMDGGQPYIVMQFIDGRTLREVINENSLSLERIADITEQTAEALAAAHEKDVLHRDLKPENIMLQKIAGGREQVKIIDFGIAKVSNSQVAASTTGLFAAGTLYYLAPETLLGKPYSPASDIFVLALIVYEMLTGKRPYQPQTDNPILFPSQLLEMQEQGIKTFSPEVRRDLPLNAEKVLLKAMAFDSSERYQNVAEFGRDFAQAVKQGAALPVTVFFGDQKSPAGENHPPKIETNFLPAPVRPSRNKRLFAIVPLVACLLLLPLIGFALWYVIGKNPADTEKSQETLLSSTAAEKDPNSIKFWLNVQKMRDGKPFQEPFKSSGQEIFENGYKFQLNAASEKEGYLYFFNEGTNDQAGKFWILFPTPARNDGSAKISAKSDAQSGWNVFGGEAGTEKCWLIWAEDKIPELEDARQDAFESGDGSLNSASVKEKLEKFIAAHSGKNLSEKKEPESQQTSISGAGKVIVKLLTLEHR